MEPNETVVQVLKSAGDEVNKLKRSSVKSNRAEEFSGRDFLCLSENSRLCAANSMNRPQPLAQSLDRERSSREELAKASARLNGIIFSAMDAIISIDAERRIILFNPAAEKMFGFSGREVLGQKLERLIPHRFRAAHAVDVKQFGLTGVSFRRMGALGTISGLRANGEEFPIEASLSQVDVDGEKLFTVILRDVSERVKGEKALQESEARKAAILESALDCIISMDREGKVLEVNAAAERMFGFKPEEMVGREMAELIIPLRLREAQRQGLARYLATGQGSMLGKRLEMPALRRDGSEFPAELTISVFQLGGHPYFTGTLRDITERKRSEKNLQDALEQLTKANDELETRVQQRTAALRQTISDLEAFSHSLSHDMRAPLRAITNLTRIYMEDYGAMVAPAGLDLLNKVVNASKRMDRLMQDLLAFSRVTLQPIQFDLVKPEQLLRELIDGRPEFQPPKAEIELQSPLLPVRAHSASLTQCLDNLLGNAVKFVGAGVVPQVRVWSELRGEQVRLWVQDNGIGIRREAQEKVFEIFQRLHSSSEYAGSGIGLSLVRKAVERMGGRVGLESEPGKGSRFWIELPKVETPPQVVPRALKA